jgi:hypothetical protein
LNFGHLQNDGAIFINNVIAASLIPGNIGIRNQPSGTITNNGIINIRNVVKNAGMEGQGIVNSMGASILTHLRQC